MVDNKDIIIRLTIEDSGLQNVTDQKLGDPPPVVVLLIKLVLKQLRLPQPNITVGTSTRAGHVC